MKTYPAKLYHYTDQKGFISIIENKELWATKIQYLNDNKEFNLAISIANEILEEKLLFALKKQEKGVITDLVNRISKMGQLNICVCSFSEQADLLSQWRGYSNGMAGYSIGFDAKELEEVAVGNSFILRRCIYKPSEQREEISRVLDILIAKHEMNDDRIRTLEINNKKLIIPTGFVKDVKKELSLIFPLMKHHSFKEESEWRLITNGSIYHGKLNFRPGKSNLIPYTKIELKALNKKLINNIIIGHTPNRDLAISSTKDFLRKEKLNIPVNGSEIPFRNW